METIKDSPSLGLDRYVILSRKLMIIIAIIIGSNTQIYSQCSGTVYDSGGNSSAYGSSEDVTYVYSAPAGSVMELTFVSFDIENTYDYMYIYDGANTSAPLMYTLTGTTFPSVITSTGTDITLRFISDSSTNHDGWEISLSCYTYTNCNNLPALGLIAYYDFKETSGNVVHDVSGYGTPLNMTIADPANVTWNSGCGLTINSETEIISVAPATKIINALKTSNGFTIQTWVKPASGAQTGPARIITMSDGAYDRNVTLGQQNGNYVGRLRTSDASVTANGTPDATTSGGVNSITPQHIVYTWDATSQDHIIYVDGEIEYSGKRSGDLSNWDDYYLAFINEINDSRAWLGDIYSVAIYNRVLSETEILNNLYFGSCCSGNENFEAQFDCDDGAEVEMFYTGLKNDVPKTLNFNNIDNVDSVLVEIIYKTNNPGTTIYVQDDNNISYPGTYISVGLGAFIYTFNLPATSYVTYTNTTNIAYAQSLAAYAYRSGQPGKMYTSKFTSIGGHNSIQDFAIPLPPRNEVKDINVVLPISELTYDNRLLNFTLTAGTASKYVSRTWGTNGVDFPDGCCIDSVYITLEDVPTDAIFLNVEVESPASIGQSYVIAGLVYAEVECFEPEICYDDIDNDNDGSTDCEDRDCGFIQNREFDHELTNWNIYMQTGSSATVSLDETWQLSGGNSAFIDILSIGSPPVDWHIQFVQDNLSIENQKHYEIIFDAKATGTRTMVASLQLNQSPWTSYFWETVNLTTNANTYSFQFTASETQLNNIQLFFGLGASLEDVWIDNVQFKEICATCNAEVGPDQSQCQNAIFEVEADTSYTGSIGTWSIISGSATTHQSWNDPINVFTIPPGTTVLRWTVESAGICSEYDDITLTNTTSCSVDCIDPMNINGDLEDPGTITNFDLDFNSSNAALIQGTNNPAGWGERYGDNSPNTTTFNGAYYIDTSPNSAGDPYSGDHLVYLKGNQFCLSPLATSAGLSCGKTFSYSVWIAAYSYTGTQQDAPFALEFSASSSSGTPAAFFRSVQLSAPASLNWNNLNWNRYDFEITLPEDGYEWVDFYFTSLSDDHGIMVDDLCITQISAGTEALAGADMSGCTNVFNLQANTPSSGHTGTWSVAEGDISLSSFSSPTATATINSGNIGSLDWTISDGLCSSSDRVVLSYETLPVLTPIDATICPGESADISFSGCSGDILWETGETTQIITVSPAVNSTYSVSCTDAPSSNLILNGDAESAVDLENWEDWGGAGVTLDPAHVRSGNKALLVEANGAWAGLGQTINVTPGEHYTITFWAKTNNSNKVPSFGISFFNNTWENISDVNVIEIKSSTYQQYTLSGIAPLNSSYLQFGGGVSSPAEVYLDDIVLTEGSQCERSIDVNVTILDLPVVSASNDGPLTCSNTTVTLTALPAGMTYAWTGGGSGQTKNVSAIGVYNVTVTDGNGCQAVASTEVFEDLSTPTASASVTGVITCNDLTATVTASPAGLTYAWSGGGNGQSKNVTTGGYHTVTVTSSNGCFSVDSVYVIADNIPPTVSLVDMEACDGTTLTLTPEVCENYPDIVAHRPLTLSGWRNIYGNLRSPLKSDGELCFTLDSCHLSSAQMIGLNTDPNTNNSYTSIDFAMYIYIRADQNRTLIQIRESGSSRGNAFDTSGTIIGSTLCIRRTGTTIEYLKDGVVIFTSSASSSGDLFYDHSIHSNGGVWTNGYTKFTNIGLCGDVDLDYNWSSGETTKSIDVTSTGNNIITVTDAKGCSTIAQSDVTINPNPTASAQNNGPGTCTNPNITITAEPAGLNYLWEDGSTNQTRVVNAAGTYFVTVTNSGLCSDIASTIVEFSDGPVVDVTGDVSLCEGETTTLSPTSGGTWSSSNTSVAIVSNNGNVASIGPGTVTFTFTDSNTGCVSNATEVVTVHPDLSVSIDYNDGICIQDGSQLTAMPVGGSPIYTYAWQGPNGLNTTGKIIDINDSGNYYLTVTDAAGCTAESQGYVYEQFDPFIFTLSTDVCEGEDVTLTVNSGSAVTFAWDSNAGNSVSPSITVTPSPPSTTYYVTVTNDIGCTSVANATINVKAKTNVSILGGSDICIGGTTQLSPSSGGIWSSSNNSVAGVSATGLVTGIGSGTATFVFNNSTTNCDSDPTTPITVNPKTAVSITGPTILCEGETSTLSPISGGSWQSSDPTVATVSNDGTVTAIGHGTVTFIFTNSTTGCASDATSEITINPKPDVAITGPDEICVGVQTFLTPTSGGIWESSNPEIATITNLGIVTGISQGTSYFTFTSSLGCTGEVSEPITIGDNLVIDLDGDPILCENESQTLTASVAGGVWSSSNSSIASIHASTGVVTGIASGNVMITYNISGSGCYLESEIALEIKTTPTGFISGSTTICAGEVTTLTSSTSGSWSSGDTDIAIVSNDGIAVGVGPGTVTFTFTAINGCSSIETGTLTVSPDLDVSIDFGEMICLTDDMQLTAIITGGTPSFEYSWTGPGGFASDLQIIDVVLDGNYELEVVDSLGCSTTTSAFVYAAYEPFIFALDTEVCEGEDITLSVNSASSAQFQWSANAGSSTQQSVTVIPTYPSSLYTVTITNSLGCSTVATADITVHAEPVVVVTGNTTICEGATTTLSPTTGGIWTTSNNNVASVTNAGVVTGHNAGTATFTFRNSTTDCVSEPSVPVTVGNNTVVSINGNDQLCVGISSTLTTSAAGGTWSSSNTGIVTVSGTGELTPISEGTATISYTFSSNVCYENGTLEVTVNDVPTININGPSTICEGQTTFLIPTSGGIWTSSDESVAVVSNIGVVTGVSSGSATFTFTSAIGCSKTLATPLTVLASPDISFSGPSIICIDETTTLQSSAAGIWISSNSNVATVNSSGVVTAINDGTVTFTFIEFVNGCSSDETLTLTVNDIPTISAPIIDELCVGETTTIGPVIDGTWSSTDPSVAQITNEGLITAIASGSASFIYTNSFTGCSSDASSPILIEGEPTISLIGPDELCPGETTNITPTTGGIWSSTDVSVATITNQGDITAISPGEVRFLFTNNSTGCTSDSSTIVTVDAPINVEVTGADNICVDESTTLSPNSGGSWESSDANIATVTNSGVVTAHQPGIVSFTFTSIGFCTSDPTTAITINPKPNVTFVGPSEICIGSTTEVSPSTGGTWTSSNSAIATISNDGIITGISVGLANFTFTNTSTGCSANTQAGVNVYSAPSVLIDGSDELCIGGTTNMQPSTGGLWTSSNNSIATISASGVVTAMNEGTVTFTYTESGTGCQSVASQPITILPKPIAYVDGDNTICAGESTTLSPNTGGSWISSNDLVATVTDDGIVQGHAQGIAKFTFVSNQSCSSNETSPVIVFDKPGIIIDGPDLLCLGDNTQMIPSTGGIWQSTDVSVATITNTGLVTSVSEGTVRFIFTDSNTGCPSDMSDLVTINDAPTISTLGSDEICIGTTTQLSPTAGGVWTSLNQAVAVVLNNGEVTGISPGTATFVFTELATGCVSQESEIITVKDGPAIVYTGDTELCIGEFSSITPNTGGTWTSTNTSVATITNSGVIEAIAQGVASFKFTESGTGCISQLSNGLTVNGNPTTFVTGNNEICISSTTSLSPSTGGVWYSSNPSVATVTSNGIVTGVSPGTASFTFEDTTTGCSSDGNISVLVNGEIPVSITGESDICIGYTTTLSPSSGGVWVSHNPKIASVTNSGIVKGLAPGKVTFEFIDVSSGCTSGGVTDEILIKSCVNHDFNVAIADEAITGNLNTNDNINASAIYSSAPILITKPAGSFPLLAINADGSYTFVSMTEGKYWYEVPICLPPYYTGCPKSILEINVVDNIYSFSNPVSNLEFATTYMGPDELSEGIEITNATLDNDECVYTGGCDLDASTVSIVDPPSNGSTVIDVNGQITYTPNAGFIGLDTLEYQVCVTGESKCSVSKQVITVNHNSAVNSTVPVDDFGFILKGGSMSGNVLSNDTDPEGDNIAVVPAGSLLAPIAITGGEYYIDALGNYTFIPDDSFTGSTDIIYTICDDNAESACTDATIHILVFDYMSVNIRVYLEGAMMQNGGATSNTSGLPLMRDDLRSSPHTADNYIPIDDPYTVLADPFMNTPSKFNRIGPGLMAENIEVSDYSGVMTVSGDNAIVDWVHVELRSKDDMTLPIATRSGLLQRDGDVVDVDGVSSLKFQGVNVDSFYVVIKHRSHLGVMSMMVSNEDVIDFTDINFATFDFGTTKGNGIDYTGLAQKNTLVNGYNVLWGGDFDSNGKVKFTNPSDDKNIMFIDVLFNSPSFLINYDNAYGYLTGDFNMDGKTKFTNPFDDLNYLYSQLLLYPNNTSFLSNFNSMIEQIPE